MSLHPKRQQNPHAKRPTVRDKETDGLLAKAWTQGWWVEEGRKGLKCYPPSDDAIVSVHRTPSDHRNYQNLRTTFRRSGLQL